MNSRSLLVLLVILVAGAAGLSILLGSLRDTRESVLEEMNEQARSLAASAGAIVDLDLNQQAFKGGSWETDAYRSVEQSLRRMRDDWREAGVEVLFVFTLVEDAGSPSGWVYSVDAEELPEDKASVGEAFEVGAVSGREQAVVDLRVPQSFFYADDYGTYLSGFFPVRDDAGAVRTVVGVDLPIDSVIEKERALFWSGLQLLGAMTAGWVLVGWCVATWYARPLRRLGDAAARIADGDLAVEVPIRGVHETRVLGRAIAAMAASLRGVLGEVKETTAGVVAASDQMQSRAVEQRGGAQSIVATVAEITASANAIAESGARLAETLASLREASDQLRSTSRGSVEGLRAIETSMDRLERQAGEMRGRLQVIEERGGAVTGLLDAMTRVATRTNLLSINAQIESEKAGEAGRGFAVVAREISTLADAAASSALDIEEHLASMRQAVQAGSDGVARLVDDATTSGRDTTRIAAEIGAGMTSLDGLLPRIAAAAGEADGQRQGAEEIASVLGTLVQSAVDRLAMAEEGDAAAAELRERSRRLAQSMDRFRT